MKPIQQGDVFIQKINEIPKGSERVHPKNGRYVLAEGEATGHAHTIDVMEGIDMFRSGKVLYLSLGAETIVHHEEHEPVTVPAGTFQIARVNEIDPFTEEIRAVRD